MAAPPPAPAAPRPGGWRAGSCRCGGPALQSSLAPAAHQHASSGSIPADEDWLLYMWQAHKSLDTTQPQTPEWSLILQASLTKTRMSQQTCFGFLIKLSAKQFSLKSMPYVQRSIPATVSALVLRHWTSMKFDSSSQALRRDEPGSSGLTSQTLMSDDWREVHLAFSQTCMADSADQA